MRGREGRGGSKGREVSVHWNCWKTEVEAATA